MDEEKKSKKKKKKKHGKESILDTIDYQIDQQYKQIIGDIEEIQYEIYLADQKKSRREKKKAKKKYGLDSKDLSGFQINAKSIAARIDAANKLTDETFVERILTMMQEIQPIVVIVARLICALICAILSITAVKASITKQGLDNLNNIYSTCLRIGQVQP